ncbi:alginate lyase family protein [Terriglobus roseus]|uniref:Alginate lyase n=1 Tax=Terriglobus roseus TaxID=392734 RepID=A0A1H4JRW9_9BACT|nr:alginate lyase family protein [Terriglobus roseus]SEB49029.1 Alginate lyase [Terriglobus roseus]
MDPSTQWSRRTFCFGAAVTAALRTPLSAFAQKHNAGYDLVAQTDRNRITAAAARYRLEKPETITAVTSPRSPGGPHDFFSEADYFWPDPANPNGPYKNRDGESNPGNFNEHRKRMIRLSIQMPALTASWVLTGNRTDGTLAADHLRAWFITPATRMNPNLQFSQGVHGVSTGRNFGIIDTLHLVEVARAASLVAPAFMSKADRQALHAWFAEYLHWMKTSAFGIAERDTKNNHAVCWALQASEFARLIGDEATRSEVRTQYETIFLTKQMAPDGSFPLELARTKPYGYSIFNFDVMAMLCQSLLESSRDVYAFALPTGQGICKGAAFLYPYLKDKSSWPYTKDVQHFESWPVRSPGLLFTGLACGRADYLALWKTLPADPTDPEIIRNYPVRQPLLWFGNRARG